jgi:26S proteasome regulatory subunit N2
MLNTATSYLALLQEDDITIKSIALEKINILVDEYWAEISDYIKDLEDLYTSNKITERNDLIALVLSKIYYNLEDYDSAIEWALESNTRFDISEKSHFVNTILKKIIEKYIQIRKDNFFSGENNTIDHRINSIVDRIFKTCLDNRAYNQAIGFSLESYDLERVYNF